MTNFGACGPTTSGCSDLADITTPAVDESEILAVGDVLLVLGEDGELVLVEASPDGHRELASLEALQGQTWNNLCLTGNKLLVRNAEEAACYELSMIRQATPEARSAVEGND